jgi:hypothetical membrane protein
MTVLASAYLLVAILIYGRRKPGYSHIAHTISELGEAGTPDQRAVALGVFLPVGLLLAAVACVIGIASPPQFALAACLAAGYVVAGLFACDAGSPPFGSFRQTVHNLGGAIEYGGGALSLMWLAESQGQLFRVAGVMVAMAMVAVSFESGFRGGIQRIAEMCLFGGLGLSLWLTRKAPVLA